MEHISEHNEEQKNNELLYTFIKGYSLQGVRSIDVVSKDRTIHAQKAIQTILDCSLRIAFHSYNEYRLLSDDADDTLVVRQSQAVHQLIKLFEEQCLRLVQNTRIHDVEKMKLYHTFANGIWKKNHRFQTQHFQVEAHEIHMVKIFREIEENLYVTLIKAYSSVPQELSLSRNDRKLLRMIKYNELKEDPTLPVDPEVYVLYLLIVVLMGSRQFVDMCGENIVSDPREKDTLHRIDAEYGDYIQEVSGFLSREIDITMEIQRLRWYQGEMSLSTTADTKVSRDQYFSLHEEYLKEWAKIDQGALLSMHDFTFGVASSSIPMPRVEVVNGPALFGDRLLDSCQHDFNTVRWMILAEAPMTNLTFNTMPSEKNPGDGRYSFSIEVDDVFLGDILVLDLATGMISVGNHNLNKGNDIPFIRSMGYMLSLIGEGFEYMTELEMTLLEHVQKFTHNTNVAPKEEEYEEEDVLQNTDAIVDKDMEEYYFDEKKIGDKIVLMDEAIVHVDNTLYEVVPMGEGQEHVGYVLKVLERMVQHYEIPEGYTLRKLPKYTKALGWKDVRNILRNEFQCEIRTAKKSTHFKVIRRFGEKVRTSTVLAPQNTYYAKRAKYGTIKSVLFDLQIPEIVFWRAASGQKIKDEVFHRVETLLQGS